MLRSVVLGLVQGAVYWLLAAGVVLVFRTTRTLNFAQAEFGSVAAFVAFGLFANRGLPYGVAVVLGLAVTILVGLLVERVVVRALRSGPPWALTLGTVAAALFLVAATILAAKPEPRRLPPAVPGGALGVGGAALTSQHLVVALVVLASGAGLLVLLRRTTLGLALRASAEDRLAAALAGISERGVSRLVWCLAALLGGLAGLVEAPLLPGFAPGFMTVNTLVPALTAAVLAGTGGLAAVFVAGEAVGVAQAVGLFSLGETLHVPGAAQLTVFLLVLVVLLIRPAPWQEREA